MFIICSLYVTICLLYIHYIFTIYSLYIRYMFTIYSLYVHHMFTICSLYIHYVFTIYSLYIHYMFTIYSLYVHYIFTICSLYVHYICRLCFSLLRDLLGGLLNLLLCPNSINTASSNFIFNRSRNAFSSSVQGSFMGVVSSHPCIFLSAVLSSKCSNVLDHTT